jgi:hypothetical protein
VPLLGFLGYLSAPVRGQHLEGQHARGAEDNEAQWRERVGRSMRWGRTWQNLASWKQTVNADWILTGIQPWATWSPALDR